MRKWLLVVRKVVFREISFFFRFSKTIKLSDNKFKIEIHNLLVKVKKYKIKKMFSDNCDFVKITSSIVKKTTIKKEKRATKIAKKKEQKKKQTQNVELKNTPKL